MSTVNPLTPAPGEIEHWAPLPTDLDLPDSDGAVVDNFLQLHLANLLNDTLRPVLRELHPGDQFILGADSGIYWRIIDPPLKGCKAPDWFYIPGVSPYVGTRVRRSYVLWQEIIPPTLILEFVSNDSGDELDQTPWEGKFWVYERGIRAAYYGIYYPEESRLDLHVLQGNRYVRMEPNAAGRFPFPSIAGVELGLWHGTYNGIELDWPRWWNAHGVMLPTSEELAEQERQRAEQERQRAEQERQRAERLAERLRALGQNPDEG
jgi:Uma2 family endonuclease